MLDLRGSRWTRVALAGLLLVAATPLPAPSPLAPAVALGGDDDRDQDDRDQDDRDGGEDSSGRGDGDDRSDDGSDDRSGDRTDDRSNRGSNDRERADPDDERRDDDGLDDSRGRDRGDDRARDDEAGGDDAPDEDAARPARQVAASGTGSGRSGLEPIARGGGDVVSGEILAIGLPLAVRAALWFEGYRLLEEQALDALGLRVSRLALPRGRGVGEVVRELARRFPQTRFTPNMVYLLGRAETLACGSRACAGAELIGRRRVAATCPGGVRIGMLDTAVDRTAEPLRASVIRTRRIAAGEPVAAGHGTTIATLLVGRVAGRFSGLAPGAELLAGDVFWQDREGRPRSDALTLAQGLDWLLASGVDVVNLSLAGPPNVLLETAVGVVTARGVPVVAAVGNGGPQSPVGYPAAYPSVIGVTAVDRRLRVYPNASRGSAVTFAAPGVDLWLPLDGGRLESGTSLAAAVVTGAIAERLARERPADLHGVLRQGVRDLGAPGLDPVFGWGLVSLPPACG